MYTEDKNGLKLLRFDNFKGLAGVACAVSTRPGGVSRGAFGGLDLGVGAGADKEALAKNLALFCGAFGADPAKLADMRQKHTANVAVVEAGGGAPFLNTDGLVTNVPGVPLITRSADCGVSAFYDPVRRALGVCHTGWRGALQNLYGAMVNAMRLRYGTNPADLIVGVGPMITAAHYQVREDFLEKLQAFYPEDYRRFLTMREGTHYFSQRELLRHQLDQLGVKKYEFMHLCTWEARDLLYSWRRDGAATGHFALMAMLK